MSMLTLLGIFLLAEMCVMMFWLVILTFIGNVNTKEDVGCLVALTVFILGITTLAFLPMLVLEEMTSNQQPQTVEVERK